MLIATVEKHLLQHERNMRCIAHVSGGSFHGSVSLCVYRRGKPGGYLVGGSQVGGSLWVVCVCAGAVAFDVFVRVVRRSHDVHEC